MHYWLLPSQTMEETEPILQWTVSEDISMFRSNYLTIKDEDNTHSDTSSENSSVFDNERRGSIVSTTTSIEPVDYVTINNYKFYSQEYTFTTVEKQYISNCIPDLNSFDKWNGKLITVSNVDHFIRDKRSFEDKDDVFISYAALGNLVQSYDKNHITTHPCLPPKLLSFIKRVSWFRTQV